MAMKSLVVGDEASFLGDGENLALTKSGWKDIFYFSSQTASLSK